MNLIPVTLNNVKLEKENSSSLPILIQLVQNVSSWANDKIGITDFDKYPASTPRKPGIFGNYGYAFSVETPNIKNMEGATKNIKELYSAITTFKSPKLSKHEIFSKFYIIKISDYSNQALSVGLLDFTPVIFVNGYKLAQSKISMIRSFTSKEVFLLFDKSDKENISTFSDENVDISIVIKFKHYYKKHIFSRDNDIQSITLGYNQVNDEYYGTTTYELNKLSESNLKDFDIFIKDNGSYLRLINSDLYYSLKLNNISVNEYASRQIETKGSTSIDYFKIIYEILYGFTKDNLYSVDGSLSGNRVTLKFSFKNPFNKKRYNELFIQSISNFTEETSLSNAELSSFKFNDISQFSVYSKNVVNDYGYKKLCPYKDFDVYFNKGYISEISSRDSIIYANSGFDRVIPFIFTLSDITDSQYVPNRTIELNMKKLLLSNNIPINSDRFYAEVYMYETSPMTSESPELYRGGKKIASSISNDKLSFTFTKNGSWKVFFEIIYYDFLTYEKIEVSPNIDMNDYNNNLIKYYNLPKNKINDSENKFINKFSLGSDPLINLFTDNKEHLLELKTQDFIAYNGDILDNVLVNNEPRIYKKEYSINGSLKNKYLLNSDGKTDFIDSFHNEIVKDKNNLDSLYSKYLESTKNNYKVIEGDIKIIKDNIFKGIMESLSQNNINLDNYENDVNTQLNNTFSFLLLKLKSSKPFDLIITKKLNENSSIYKIEYKCVPYTWVREDGTEEYYYIHLPFYFDYIKIIPDLKYNYTINSYYDQSIKKIFFIK